MKIESIFNEIQLNDVIKVIFEDRFDRIEDKVQILEKIEQYKWSWYNNPENFRKFCFYIIEHLSELLLQSKSHEEL